MCTDTAVQWYQILFSSRKRDDQTGMKEWSSKEKDMRKIFRKTGGLLILLLGISMAGLSASAEETAKKVDVMFLHDTHSHLNEFVTVEDGEAKVVGGFAKIKTLIDEQKEKNPETLLLDAGDFSMGTLIQTVYEEEAAELRMLGTLGFDALTFGNHEFDYHAKGLANMLDSAKASQDPLPEIVVCNVDWDSMKEKGLTEDQQLLYDAFEDFGVRDYIMTEKNGVRIAVLGVFGKDSLACAPNCPLEFRDPVEAVKETVSQIMEKEEADMIVCVSHSGTMEDEEKSEDELLAKNVPELDLIISGHTHTKMEEPIIHGDTHIVSVEEYGKYLGSLTMLQKSDGRWELEEHEFLEVNETIAKDEEVQKKIDGFDSLVNEKYLKQFGYTKDQVLCTNEVEFATQSDTEDRHTEVNLGSLIADAYTYGAEEILGKDTVAMSVAPSGTIRDTYAKGEITTEQVFNSFSLGIGKDGVPGYPLIAIYLNGAELKIAAEIDASISDFMTTARLYTDGLYWHYNPNRMILNKVTDVFLVNNQEERVELENNRLYLVVTDYYTSQMLGGVTDLSYGLLSIVPKYADGTPVTDYEDVILTKDGKELKAWVAIADYMRSFRDTDGDGIGNVPLKYASEEGRKVVEDSKNILDLLKDPNKYFFMIVGVILLILAIFATMIVLIAKLVKKLRRKKQ